MSLFTRWFSDRGIRSGALSRLGVDISLIGLALLPFNAALAVLLVPVGVVLTFAGLPAVIHGLDRHEGRRTSQAGVVGG